MHIKDKLFMERYALKENGAITIVAFGDSVTHGALSGGEINHETVYHNRLKKKLNTIRSYVPVNVINAGVGGLTAKQSVERLESQVLCHRPDLIIICFGLNDINEPLSDFLEAMEIIFDKCIKSQSDVIYMSPNMLNTYVADDTPQGYFEYASKLAELQNSGQMDLYIESVIRLAERMGVTVCDCYSEWKKLSGETDTTMLLCNRMNHPNAQMHELFAQKLFEIIAGDIDSANINSDTMYKE